MVHVPAPHRRTHDRRRLVAGLFAVIVGVAGVFGYQSWATSSTTAASPVDRRPGALPPALGEADGAIPEGTTVFDDAVPGVTKLDASLLAALREAASIASDDGVTFSVESGWRSPAYQEQLLQEAIAKYGSREEAARWVASPTTSAHVRGAAVDIAGSDATAWLARHGARYGLCRTYDNEPWHYEFRPRAVERGCPRPYADPTHDPRMQP
jgi:hypothetical protein